MPGVFYFYQFTKYLDIQGTYSPIFLDNKRIFSNQKNFCIYLSKPLTQLDMKKFDFETVEKKVISAADLGSVIGLGILVVCFLGLIIFNIARL